MIKKRFFKKLACIAASATLLATTLLGCGGGGSDTLQMWTFVDLHAEFYQEMLDLWNEQNPDKQLKIKFTVLPYDDMHNKLQTALLSGKGAPDICDVEVGKFPNFMKGEPQLEVLNDVVAPYKDDIVQSRLDLYSKDGNVYGLPTHVGATVAYYNVELLEAAGIDYTKIVTWDDFKKAGEKYYAATGKYLGTSDTSALWQVSSLLAQQGSDYTDASGNPTVNTPQMVKALTMLKDLQGDNVSNTIPGGQPDTESAYGSISDGEYACAILPMWFMSRYLNYMPDLAGKIAIAPVPVLEKGMPRSVGGGGTGTVVTKTAKNKEIVKEFLAFAKLSKEGNVKIWEKLGFDPCNTDIWTDESITHNPDNEYVKYFVNNPFDVLNEIKDEIKIIKSTEASPTINNVFCTVTLNSIFEDGKDIKTALDEAQSQIENELK